MTPVSGVSRPGLGAPGLAVIGLALLCLAAPDPLWAENDFTFKRIKPPTSKTAKRSLVQIDPEEQARLMAPPVAPDPLPKGVQGGLDGAVALLPAVVATGGAFDWYWQEVPPGLGDVAGRFTLAMATLSKGPGVNGPRMQHMQDIAGRYGIDILKATIGTRVSPALALAVIGIESAGRADAVSSAGAQGLMQLIPATAERFGVTDSKDAAQNIKGGVAYLNWLMKEFDGDPVMVLAAYNAGEGAVKANGGVPPYAETRAYVPKVLAAWQVAQGLCQTPPELVSDPCVFKVIAAGG
ncbi:MAG: lytic transglycosylase domain-containing protein [Gemmobacter sp.]|nr:lytic transglycosylase domain-containing protein [Gemmobacter sp.]